MRRLSTNGDGSGGGMLVRRRRRMEGLLGWELLITLEVLESLVRNGIWKLLIDLLSNDCVSFSQAR
jgi:hypothetical protein